MQTSKRLLGGSSLALALCLLPAAAGAIEIRFQATHLAGDEWRYDYFASDSTFLADHGFTVFFELGLYSGLATPSPSPSGWDTLVAQPEATLEGHGFFDAFAESSFTPLAEHFSVSFIWHGGTAPGAQPFEVYSDPPSGPFEIIGGGTTVPLGEPIPEPSTLLLVGAGAAYTLGRRRGTS